MLKKRISGYFVAFSWVLFFIFGIYLFNFSLYSELKKYSKGAEIPEERFGFAHDYFYEFLESIGEAGRAVYFNFQLLDYINLLLLGLTLFITIYYFLTKINSHKIFKFILIFPLLLIVLDFSENSLILYLISSLPEKATTLAGIVGFVTKLKIISGMLAFMSFLISGITLIVIKLYLKIVKKS